MRKIYLFTLFLFFIFFEMNAQRSKKLYSLTPTITDLNIGNDGLVKPIVAGTMSIMLSAFGPAYCFGDPGVMSTKKFFMNVFDVSLLDTRFMYSLGLRHIFPNNVGVKATAYFGTFKGTDVGSLYPARGYSFKTNVMEFTLHAEYIFMGGPNSKRLNPHTMYVFAGAGILHSNAILKYGDILVSAPAAERSTDKIQLIATAPVIPVGLGYQFRINSRWSLGAEFAYHTVFSDFVDGLQTVGSKKDDALSSISFTFAYKLFQNRYKNPCNCNF